MIYGQANLRLQEFKWFYRRLNLKNSQITVLLYMRNMSLIICFLAGDIFTLEVSLQNMKIIHLL